MHAGQGARPADEQIGVASIARVGVSEASCSTRKRLCSSGEPLIGVREPAKRGGEARCSIGVTAMCGGKAPNFTRQPKSLAGKALICVRQPAKRGGEAFCSIGVTANCPGKVLNSARKAKSLARKPFSLARKAQRLAPRSFDPCARS
ncbi:hypothetical protein [Candidatus Accumulibacter sp. ACC003]|uniref:hypothetical protein n=1 Tax=Candidatus Accumulibacter sp. ACC003 TaxID=2823334 RepID=UPI0025C564AA|nr:hypothetical protein [Candidatus Accumulibacter sp. ACC003]